MITERQQRSLCRASRFACVVLLATTAACRHKSHQSRLPQAPQASGSSTREVHGKHVAPVAVGYSEQGIASWYGVPYHGRPAADGEIYNMEALVAAHRTLPFNTWLRVTNLQNSKSVDVRVIDRGPFVGDRILDLSKAAARQIELLGPGVGPVRLEVISAPADIRSNDFFAVQVAAFSVYANAEKARQQYAARFGSAQLAVKQGSLPLYRLLVGKVSSLSDAQQLAAQLRTETAGVFVVRLDETVISGPPAPAPSPVSDSAAPLSH